MLICPECGKLFSPRGLGLYRHLKFIHKYTPGESWDAVSVAFWDLKVKKGIIRK